VENALFATLDPTVRRTTTPDGRVYTLADTVGFVRNLPTQLVEAFRSTLEEVADSDLIVHVVDGSHPDPEGQISAVRTVFSEIGGVEDIPELVVLNKADMADPEVIARVQRREINVYVVSAHTGQGIGELLEAIADALPRPGVFVDVVVPYSRGDLISRVHEHGEIEAIEHVAEGTSVRGRVDADLATELQAASVR
jgi:GTP-binding protein HflX